MLKKFSTLLFSLFLMTGLFGQEPVFKVELSQDSLLLGNRLEVTFTLENAQDGELSPPAFEGLNLIAGPNYSTMMSIVNGNVSQQKSYTYILEPTDIGNYFIPPASIKVGDQILETQPVEIMIVPNPDGIIQNPRQERTNDWFFNYEPPVLRKQKPGNKPKKKRKIYKI